MRISDWSSDVCSSDLEDQRRGHDKVTEFTLTPTGRGAIKSNVQITQTYDVEYGWNLICSYAGLYVRRHVGDDMKLGLSRLSNMLDSVPNIDSAVEGSRSEGRRVGKEGDSRFRYRWWDDN